MVYGSRQEHHALSSYQQLAPQEALREMGFALWGADEAHGWLAASPDGLITSSGVPGVLPHPAADRGSSSSSGSGSCVEVSGGAASSSMGVSEEVAAWVQQQTGESEAVMRLLLSFVIACVDFLLLALSCARKKAGATSRVCM